MEQPVCSSCNGRIAGEVPTRFFCPNCGEHEFWRCRQCKILSRKYRCPRCGFEGP